VLNKIRFLISASFLLLWSFAVMAASLPPPDPRADVAGPTLRELQQQLDLKVPQKKSPPPRIEGGASTPAVAPNENARMLVKGVHVTGITVFPAAELESVVAYLVGSEHNLSDINEGAARITTFYHEHGYVVGRAYVPPQEIKDGVVTINVLEGHIGKQIINNQSRLSDQHANDYLTSTKSGDVLQAAPVDRQLFLLNEIPGVATARAALQPGASVGTADIVYELTPSDPYNANIEADNYGNYYTGEYRAGAELVLNSPSKRGDQLTLRAMDSSENLAYGYVAYQVPVGGSGLRLGAAYFDTSYRLGKSFIALQSHGTASSGSLFAVYPFIRNLASSLTGTLTFERKNLVDKYLNPVGSLPVTSDKQVQLANLGLNGKHQDALGGAGVTSFDLSLVSGRLSMDADSLSFDDTSLTPSAHTNGAFMRFNYNVNRLQRLTDSYTLSLALSGQYASKNLNSSEQFSLGGANGVRAYPQGEANGDEGRLATIELRRNITQSLQGVIFYDAGSVIINRNPYLASANALFRSGVGAGVNGELLGLQFKTSLALRTSSAQPTAEPTTINRKIRLWLQLSKQF
jgi:hemolysin activation/secretion protein